MVGKEIIIEVMEVVIDITQICRISGQKSSIFQIRMVGKEIVIEVMEFAE